jgi:hypothetical protein
VLVVRSSEDVARAQVDLVRVAVALDVEEAALQGAAVGYRQAGDEAFEQEPAGLGALAEVAEAVRRPVLLEAAAGAAVLSGGVVADAGDADEQVDVAQDFGEDQGRDVLRGTTDISPGARSPRRRGPERRPA